MFGFRGLEFGGVRFRGLGFTRRDKLDRKTRRSQSTSREGAHKNTSELISTNNLRVDAQHLTRSHKSTGLQELGFTTHRAREKAEPHDVLLRVPKPLNIPAYNNRIQTLYKPI